MPSALLLCAALTSCGDTDLSGGTTAADGPEGPPTEDDPSFQLIHVQDFHEIAQYEPGTNEPTRTGKEAWNEYVNNSAGQGGGFGVFPSASLSVQGVLLGDDRTWDEINIVQFPSTAAFSALIANDVRQDGSYHRLAALANNYSLITCPSSWTSSAGTGRARREVDPWPRPHVNTDPGG